ncbi:MAG TPA: HlyD family efflux transporter periplasmic adaptor subunit [Candidatus Acidoferrales bacterium]|nr:HlyD family efflux transporter periplasmic adaptor subunit [Candidatus Acidoferrales bacterium]
MKEHRIYASTATAPATKSSETRLPLIFTNAEEPPKAPKRRRYSAAIIAIIVIAIAIGAYFVLRKGQAGVAASGGVETATAVTKDFASFVRLNGSTEAVRSRAVLAPRLEGAQLNTMVVTKLAAAGTRVHTGDLLVEFDRQAQIKDSLDKKAAYQDLVDQVAQKQAGEVAARAKDEDELHQADDALQKAQLEMGRNEILSKIDAEKNQEALTEAQENLKQLQHTFDLKRQAAAADIKTLEIQRDRAQATMVYAQSNAQKMEIHSPMDGVVVLNNVWLGGRMGEVQEGDEVRPGVPFMKVVDPSAMQVRVEVNQADLLDLHEGQRATIHLDAYPDLTFPGTLEELTPLGHASDYSDKVRSFTAVFSIQGTDPKLMPDLSAAVDVELANVKNALVVPAESVHSEAGEEFVWLKTGSGFVKRAVKTGPSDGQQTVIETGLKANDVVRIGSAASEGAGSGNSSQ